MSEYMNPFSGMPETNFPSNPFWSGVKSGERETMMAPFRGMEQQRQQLGLQQQQQTNQEFSSPEAVALRQQKTREAMSQSQVAGAKADAEIKALPEEQQLRLIQVRQKILSEQAAPAKALYSAIGSFAPVLEKTPEQMRPAVYSRFLEQIKQTNPGVQIPEQFLNYNQKIYDGAKEIWLAQTMTPAHAQKLAEITTKEDRNNQGNMAVQKLRNEGGIAEAKIREGGATARHAETLKEGKRNVGQMRAQQTAILNNPKSSQEEKETAEENLRSLATAEFANVMKADKALESMGITAIGKSPDSPEVQSLQKYQGGLWEKHLERMGVVVRMEHPTKKQRNGKPEIQLVPKSRYKEAKEAGFVDSK